MLLSARGRIPTHAERTLSAYTISKVTWRDGAPCFRGHGASVAAMPLGLLVELELARAATHSFYRGRVLILCRDDAAYPRLGLIWKK